jgi:hypothetical protein
VSTDHHRSPIDVEQVADQVYRLLLADVRLDVARARGGVAVRER